jgi:hypothetical protein
LSSCHFRIGVERVTQRLADEHQQRQDQRQGKTRSAQPRRLQVLLALGDQFAQRRAAGRHAEAEKSSAVRVAIAPVR